MEFTVHLDGDPAIREEGFFASKVTELENQIKVFGFQNAELAKANEELRERVTKLASRQPSWPKGYRPNSNRR